MQHPPSGPPAVEPLDLAALFKLDGLPADAPAAPEPPAPAAIPALPPSDPIVPLLASLMAARFKIALIRALLDAFSDKEPQA